MTGAHTSFLLDLKNRAVDHKFLNIHTEQSPEVPYATWRRFVYGSPQGSVMVSGRNLGLHHSLRSWSQVSHPGAKTWSQRRSLLAAFHITNTVGPVKHSLLTWHLGVITRLLRLAHPSIAHSEVC